MSIRIATADDVHQIADLVYSLAHFYLNESESELPAWFLETLSHSNFALRISSPTYINLVYEINGLITGYIALKGGSHLYHLFVSEKHQSNGIARKLWEAIKQTSPARAYTLRSSLYAVPIYKRFGFVETDSVSTKDGISFQPMAFRNEI